MLLDLLFPKTCLSCGKWGKYICVQCQAKLDYLTNDTCIYCQRNSYLGFTHKSCRKENGIDGVLSIICYNSTAKKIIKGIKYRLVRTAFKELFASFPENSLEKFIEFTGLIPEANLQPIPLHFDRQAKRGFNQSLICAKFFHSVLSYPIINRLDRTINTLPQAQTASKRERQENIQNAFQAKEQKGIVILVDDVITTGSTCSEAAKVLKKQGAKAVFVLTIARD